MGLSSIDHDDPQNREAHASSKPAEFLLLDGTGGSALALKGACLGKQESDQCATPKASM
jgi:hypothetical protein